MVKRADGQSSLSINAKRYAVFLVSSPSNHVDVVHVVSQDQDALWNELIERYHPLGNRRGIRVKQLAFWEGKVVAAVGWSNPALHLETRDAFIGWNMEQKLQALGHIANNARFLIKPGVMVKNLASRILSRALKQLTDLWQDAVGKKLYLVETFVDGQQYRGTCYMAANWTHLGKTKGYERSRSEYFRAHGRAKLVFVRVVRKNFRKLLGCRQRFLPAPGGMRETELERLAVLMKKATMNKELSARFDLKEHVDLPFRLQTYVEGFRECFNRAPQLVLALAYWLGLLSNLKRKNAEAIALHGAEYAPRTVQSFLTTYKWEESKMLEMLRTNAGQTFSELGGAIAFDPSDFPKKGDQSIAVYRQHCGTLGKVENCQSGVFASYVSSRGYCLLDTRLFIPKAWFGPEYTSRRVMCEIPSRVKFKTKVELAVEMLAKMREEGHLQWRWVLGDTLYGGSPAFRQAVGENSHYFLDAKKELLVKPCLDFWQPKQKGKLRVVPKPIPMGDLAEHPAVTWQLKELGIGTKGPVVAKVALFRAEIANTGEHVWVFIRHDPSDRIKFAISNACEQTTLDTFCQLSLMRWKIEQCFKECKDMLGMGDYENRSWYGWHRHMAMVMTLHFFLCQLKLEISPRNPGFSSFMACALLAAAINGTTKKAVKKVVYHLKRNAKALFYHWKATVDRLKTWAQELEMDLECTWQPPIFFQQLV